VVENEYLNAHNTELRANALKPVITHKPWHSSEKEQSLPHILIVDDENGPRQALRMLLKKSYQVSLANSVLSALRVIRSCIVDVVVTDIRMPQANGLDLLNIVRQENPAIPVIILTGYGQLETAMRAMELGAHAYMEKPFDNVVMMNKVAECIKKKREHDEKETLERLSMEANRFETLGRLVSGTLHDLGTPLSVISTHIELLMSNPHVPGLEKRLETMQAQVHHCNDLVRTIMNFLRTSSSGNEPYNLNNVLALCLDVARPMIYRTRIEVVQRLQSSLPSCTGDLVMVRQAVLNLIYNACQAMEKEKDRRLYIETYSDGSAVHFAVEDTGPGVPQDQRSQIFDALFSTKGNHGTGLGLSVVQSVMHRHGGEVYLAEGVAGNGARFILRFPIR